MTETHFNGLTPAEAERLAMLAEECGEVIHAVGKILRHGYESYDPADPSTTNRMILTRELSDLIAVTQIMDADFALIDASQSDQAIERKLRFSHHQLEASDV